jgi:hypothetical protein
MSRLRFDTEEVRLGYALYRTQGHCLAACELNARARRSDALLQAARPMTDVLPWLESEARSAGAELASFFHTVSRIGAGIRGRAPTADLRRSFAMIERAVQDVLESVLDRRVRRDSFDVAVALTLLETAKDSFEQGVTNGNLGEYHSAYATGRQALSLLEGAGIEKHARATEHLAFVRAAFPSIEPPELLVRPETLHDAIGSLRESLQEIYGLPSAELSSEEPDLDGSLARIERLLDDTVAAHEHGVPALAARLASSLFLRSYQPIRDEVSARDASIEERLTEILGVEVRIAINRGATPDELHGLRKEAKRLLKASKTG